MIRVFISPLANDGILRVIEAQIKHLPKYGVTVTHDIHDADIICNHGTDLYEVPGVPSVNINHGLYWSRQKWGDDFMEVNKMVVEAMRHAVEITAPSEWVSRAIRRGGYWYPEVVCHGIDAEDFIPQDSNDGFVLWNKARADFVSDPNDAMRVSGILTSREFRTTIGLPSTNMKILNPMKYPEMKQVVSRAGVYLATARETFGIGTLEALAYGVPVAGWDWGGQSEIIIPGQTGYLAPPGDFQALADCIEMCFRDRKRLSRNAIEDARTRWKWEPRIEQYANIFMRVYSRYVSERRPKVSVIVTAYKLDKFLPQCLDSVIEQTMPDFDCFVVDDANSPDTKKIVKEYADRDNRIHYRATPNNMGLPGARNFGLSISTGHYVRHVDADDFLALNALELESKALDHDHGIDIVYGHIEQVREDGSRFMQNGQPVRGGWPEAQFRWHYQMAHMNQLPSCVMARREVYERSGGYRVRMDRQEDAEFWCRVTSLGFRAKKITEAITYFHRERMDSKGAMEWDNEGKEPDWTQWFPWRMGGHDYQSGMEIIRKRGDLPRNTHLVPFGAQGTPPRGIRFWYVHDYAYPVVSVIVTCGPGHKPYLIDALDSIQAQNYPDWECIVVNDTGEKWGPDIMGAPWARVVNMDGNKGVSAARNEGFKYASGKYIVWLDADDYWLPWFLERMVAYAEKNHGVIYSDILLSESKKEFKVYTYPEFRSEVVATHMHYPGTSILYPRVIVEKMIEVQGGYDTKIVGMEDWDYQIGVHAQGFCAYHIPEPLFVYRMYTSTKREVDHDKIDQIMEYLDAKYPEYRKGDSQIMCGCQTPKPPVGDNPASLLSSAGDFTPDSVIMVTDPDSKQQMVVVEYVGQAHEPFTVNSRVDRNVRYRFANNDQHRSRAILLGDLAFILSLNTAGKQDYRVVSNISAPEERNPAAFLGQPIVASA